jgi:hypothetical protein
MTDLITTAQTMNDLTIAANTAPKQKRRYSPRTPKETGKAQLERAQRIMLRRPHISADELAQMLKVSITRSYKIRTAVRKLKAAGIAPPPHSKVDLLAKARAVKAAKRAAREAAKQFMNVEGVGNEYEEKNGKWKAVATVTSDKPIKPDMVNHPPHYKVGGVETIDFIEAKGLNYNLGNVVKYVTRADHKGERKENLQKAMWYLMRELGAAE